MRRIPPAIQVYDAEFIDQLISTASENIGTRYSSGGTTKDGFDCSGLMYFTFSITIFNCQGLLLKSLLMEQKLILKMLKKEI